MTATSNRFGAAIRTHLATGIRLAFSPGVRDQSKLVMGGEEFVTTLPAELGDAVRPLVFLDKEAFADDYFRLFDELYDAYDGDDTKFCWHRPGRMAPAKPSCAGCVPMPTGAVAS